MDWMFSHLTNSILLSVVSIWLFQCHLWVCLICFWFVHLDCPLTWDWVGICYEICLLCMSFRSLVLDRWIVLLCFDIDFISLYIVLARIKRLNCFIQNQSITNLSFSTRSIWRKSTDEVQKRKGIKLYRFVFFS